MGRMCFDSQMMEDLGSDYYLISVRSLYSPGPKT